MLNRRSFFNRLPYNRPSGVLGELNAAAAFYNHLNCAVGAGKEIPTELAGGAELHNEVIVTTGFTHRLDGGLELHNDTVLTPSRSLGGDVGGRLQSQVWIVKDIPAKLSATIRLAAMAWVVKDIPAPASMMAWLQVYARLVKDMPGGFVSGGLLNAHIDIAPLDVSTVKIETQILPGQTVFLDTDNFVLLIDDKNAMHAHRGDWPQLNRNTVRVEIDSGTGKPEGTLVVTPRYL